MFAELQDLLPGIINQLGPDNLSHLKKIAQQVTFAADLATPPCKATLHVYLEISRHAWSCECNAFPEFASVLYLMRPAI